MIRCFVSQFKYYTVEKFGKLIHTIALIQALQMPVQSNLFISILKCTFQTRLKIIPVSFIKGI